MRPLNSVTKLTLLIPDLTSYLFESKAQNMSKRLGKDFCTQNLSVIITKSSLIPIPIHTAIMDYV